jgi:hypothetical protein
MTCDSARELMQHIDRSDQREDVGFKRELPVLIVFDEKNSKLNHRIFEKVDMSTARDILEIVDKK